MSRTYKDVPSRLVWESIPDELHIREWAELGHFSIVVRKKARSVVRQYSNNSRPKHPAMMRSFDGAYCRKRGCCRVEGSRARARERREWQKEVKNA
jgi:hypothetical protein